MGYFDDWKKWGRPLSVEEFARAWLTLGIVAAHGGARRTIEATLSGTRGRPEAAAGAIAGLLRDVILPPPGVVRFLDWRFPRIEELARAIETAPPEVWSLAWEWAAGGWPAEALESWRVRVSGLPSGEPLAGWYSALAQAAPAPGAISIRISPPNAQLFVDWPLRFGTLAGDPAEGIVSDAVSRWPANHLARVLTLGREVSNCDLLVLVRRADAAARAIESVPGRVKADLVVLFSAEAEAAGSEELSTELMRVTHASGVLVARDTGDPSALGSALNECMFRLSHNLPLDVALSAGFRQVAPFELPVLRLSDDLADVRLAGVAGQVRDRLLRLPADSRIDLSKVRRTDLWRVRGMAGDQAFAGPKAAGMDVTSVRAGEVQFDVESLPYLQESEGALELAAVTEAVETAQEPTAVVEMRARRFLQQQSFFRRGGTLQEATGGYVAGLEAVVRVRIGYEDATWDAAPEPLREDLLPRAHREWRLTIWLTEPDHLERPLRRHVRLPRDGNSTTAEFTFTPRRAGTFEGRVTVLHRGRVLQTALLVGHVRGAVAHPSSEGTPRLALPVPVRQHMGDLEERREFDMAFVLNHNGAGQPRAVAVSRDAAGVADLTPALTIGGNINTALGAVARSVEDFKDGLEGANGRRLLVRLARHGERLRIALLNNLTPADTARKIGAQEFIQVVTTRPDTVVPFELIYDYAAPDDDAALCANWRGSLETGACGAACDTASGRFVCPGGFWGIRKVIERHAAVPESLREPGQAFLQAEPCRGTSELRLGKAALVAVSKRVVDPTPQALIDAVTACTGTPALAPGSWQLWRRAVEDNKPGLIVALTHTDGAAHQSTLEIGGDTLETILLRRQHVCPEGGEGQPLVALLGCDTAGTADAYGEPIAVFRDRGAAVVVGTIATVFGGHAASVAQLLVGELLPPAGSPPQRLGEAIRNVRRRGLLENLLMSLCIVAYGDADWRLTH
jgi:hypothetical protein